MRFQYEMSTATRPFSTTSLLAFKGYQMPTSVTEVFLLDIIVICFDFESAPDYVTFKKVFNSLSPMFLPFWRMRFSSQCGFYYSCRGRSSPRTALFKSLLRKKKLLYSHRFCRVIYLRFYRRVMEWYVRKIAKNNLSPEVTFRKIERVKVYSSKALLLLTLNDESYTISLHSVDGIYSSG